MGVLLLTLCILLFPSCGGYDGDSEAVRTPIEPTKSSGILVIETGPDPTIMSYNNYEEAGIEKYYEEDLNYSELPDDLLQAFSTSISSEEMQIISNAWIDAPSEAIRGAEAHIFVLLRALQETENTDIEIVSAEILPYESERIRTHLEEVLGCDAYALQIIDVSGSVYIVRDGYEYEEVICNGETIYIEYHGDVYDYFEP